MFELKMISYAVVSRRDINVPFAAESKGDLLYFLDFAAIAGCW